MPSKCLNNEIFGSKLNKYYLNNKGVSVFSSKFKGIIKNKVVLIQSKIEY